MQNKINKLMMLAAVAGFFSCAQAQDARDIEQATTAAQQWLALADAGQYGATHSAAAPAFRQAITMQDWEKALQAARTPLGTLTRRTLKSASYARDLPGAPKGDYVIIRFDSEFAQQKSAVETVTPMRDGDGSWKVSGYFVR